MIICGNALEELKKLPDESVSMVMTSPPYYGLRDYGLEPVVWDDPGGCEHNFGAAELKKLRKDENRAYKSIVGSNSSEEYQPNVLNNGNFCSLCHAWRGSLGLEPDFNLYLSHLIQIFGECKRILRKDGCMFINISDSYGGSSANVPYAVKTKGDTSFLPDNIEYMSKVGHTRGRYSKSLLGIPERLAIRLTDELNLIRRNTIIWHKPNCIPSSASDRFTVDFEYIYFFTKSGKYCFEQQFEALITEPHNPGNKNRVPMTHHFDEPDRVWGNPLGRNMRTVWRIPSQPYREAHFATYPEELVRRCIKAGCPEYVCSKCGQAREKIFKTEFIKRPTNDKPENYKAIKQEQDGNRDSMIVARKGVGNNIHTEIGYSQCSCSAPFVSGIVLDPFAGSGTTGAVAKELNRDYILIEQNPDYIKLIEKRLSNKATQLTIRVGG